MKKNGVLSFLVFALIFILLSKIAFAQNNKEGDFLHIYGKDIESWNEAKDTFRKDSDLILTIYFNVPCKPKDGHGSGMIGFLINKNNELVPFPPPLTGPWGAKAGFTTIPVNFKCGITQATGTIDIYVKGKIIKRGKKKTLDLICIASGTAFLRVISLSMIRFMVRSVMNLPRILVNMKSLWKMGILLILLEVFIILPLR